MLRCSNPQCTSSEFEVDTISIRGVAHDAYLAVKCKSCHRVIGIIDSTNVISELTTIKDDIRRLEMKIKSLTDK